MKTDKQYRDAMTNFIIGAIGIGLTLIMVIVLPSQSTPKEDVDKQSDSNKVECRIDTLRIDTLNCLELGY